MKSKKLTFQDLKEVVNNLTPEALQQEVLWWGDERGGKIDSVMILKEDYIFSDEGWEPKSSFDEKELQGYGGNQILPKGCAVLQTDMS